MPLPLEVAKQARLREVSVSVPETVGELLEATDGIVVDDPSSGERRLVEELHGGKNLPRRGSASVHTVPFT